MKELESLRKAFPRTNLLVSFAISKQGNSKFVKVERLGNDIETQNVLTDEGDFEPSEELKELRRMTA